MSPEEACGSGTTSSGEPLKLPGAGAATINVPGFLNSLPRLLLKTKGNLRGFLVSIVQNQADDSSATSLPGSSTWPCPLPYPEVFRRMACSRVPDAHLKRLVCLQIAVMDWLFLGMARAAPLSLRLGTRLTAKQWSIVRTLEHLAVDGNFAEFIDASDMGRSAGKIEDFQDSVDTLARAVATLHCERGAYTFLKPSTTNDPDAPLLRAGVIAGRVEKDMVVTAKPLIASRLHFPPPPQFDPRPFFDDATLDRYDQPITKGWKPEDVDELPPKVMVRATRNDKIELYKKLAASGRLKPVLVNTFHSGYTSGLFAVHKDQHKDRLILDGRPANLLSHKQHKWCRSMASGGTLAQMHLAPDEVLVCNGLDLKDFFYQFSVNAERCSRNALAAPLTEAESKIVFGPQFQWPETPIWVGLSTLAMGDVNAVEYAQASHIGLCLQKSVAEPDELMSLHGALPRGLLHIGIIVDDLIVLERVLVSAFRDGRKLECEARVAAAREAYDSVGLLHNPAKGFERQLCARFWGLEVDGGKGLVRPSSLRLWPVCLITMRVATLGLSTVGLLEALAGSWVSLLGLRRRLYSVLDIIFEPLTIPDQRQTIRLSPELVSELCTLVVLGSLACVNLRADFYDQVAATDASGDFMAAVTAPCPSGVVQEVSRHTLRKGTWTKLLPSTQARERMHGLLDLQDEVPGEMLKGHPLWDLLARCLTFSECWREHVPRPIHINVLELRAYLRHERRVAGRVKSKRLLSGLDSQVALGTLVKGRSSSKALNAEMRKSIGPALGSDIYDLHMYFNTKFNPADDPTRGQPLRSPDLPLPPWWQQVCAGQADDFDRWLLAHGAATDYAGLDFGELCDDSRVDLRPQRRVRSDPAERAADAAGVQLGCASLCSDETVAAEVLTFSREAYDTLLSFPARQFVFSGEKPDLTKPGCLDLFSGRCGVAKQLVKFKAPWVLTFDWKRSAEEDLLNPEVRKKVELLITSGAVLALGAAPICASFSVAVTPPVRSARYPRGIPGLRKSMREKVSQGNRHNDWLADLLELCERQNLLWWVENPDLSWWWRQRRWRRYRDSRGASLFRCCFCRFGCKWKKATRIATNTSLAGVRMWCTCSLPHLQLRGMCPAKGIPWTQVAEPYPRGLCRMLAAALATGVGWCGKSGLNVAGCARTGTLRVGEASHPGPRPGRLVGAFSLEEVRVVSTATQAIEARELGLFLTWCRSSTGDSEFEAVFQQAPMTLPHCLRCYGDLLFQRGGSLFNLRHLLLAAQKWCPLSKPYMSVAWEIVERWEIQVPVVHRTPIPEVLVRALCVMAWHRHWYSWVGITLLAFYGAGRLGEIICCRRRDLVFPEDLCEDSDVAFLLLRRFKSLRRVAAKVQHMKISDSTAVKILRVIYRKLPFDDFLFQQTAYHYRRKWDLLLSDFSLNKNSGLTPGGLRGGAAVMHYKRGKPIADLLWLMRLRSQITLESYLQEVAAMNALAALDDESRNFVKVVASTFSLLVHSSPIGAKTNAEP